MKKLMAVVVCIFMLYCVFVNNYKITSVKASDNMWIENLAEPTNYAYSLMVVGDTQYLTKNKPSNLDKLYSWIIDNVEAKNTKYVIGVGDITHTDSASEWESAYSAISKMEGKVPYSLVRGNHDNRMTYFDEYFGKENSHYAQQYIHSYKNDYTRARNTVHEFTAGNQDYLIVNLDMGMPDDVIEWADGIISSYPNHNVIIVTHAYLHSSGNQLNDSNYEAPTKYDATFNNGDDLWTKLIKKHANISFVFSGHVLSSNIAMRQLKGDNGNIVTQFMINPQSIDDNSVSEHTGMVAVIYFSQDGKAVDLQWYSTVQEKFYGPCNQMSFSAHTVDRGAEYVRVRSLGKGSATINGQNIYQVPATGEDVIINFIPEEYYSIGKVLFNGEDITNLVVDNSYTLKNAVGYNNFRVEYKEAEKYKLVVDNDYTKGTILYLDASSSSMFYEGSFVGITIYPKKNYTINSVKANGIEVLANELGEYVIQMPSQDLNLVIEYNDPVQNPNNGEENSSSNPSHSSSANNGASNNSTSIDANNCNSSMSSSIEITALTLISLLIFRSKNKKH